MIVRPLCRAGIAGYLAVENEKAILHGGDPRPNRLTMPLQKPAPFRLGSGALRAQLGVTQHVPDGHPRRLETAEEFDPGQDRCVIVPLALTITIRPRQ
ncbi:hypothetical protein ACVIJ6_001513 [Bradyrhizobium sp. USDA 4369]